MQTVCLNSVERCYIFIKCQRMTKLFLKPYDRGHTGSVYVPGVSKRLTHTEPISTNQAQLDLEAWLATRHLSLSFFLFLCVVLAFMAKIKQTSL